MPQQQIQRGGICHVPKQVDRIMSCQILAEQLKIDHVGDVRNRLPVIIIARKCPSEPIPGKAMDQIRVRSSVDVLIDGDRFKTDHSREQSGSDE